MRISHSLRCQYRPRSGTVKLEWPIIQYVYCWHITNWRSTAQLYSQVLIFGFRNHFQIHRILPDVSSISSRSRVKPPRPKTHNFRRLHRDKHTLAWCGLISQLLRQYQRVQNIQNRRHLEGWMHPLFGHQLCLRLLRPVSHLRCRLRPQRHSMSHILSARLGE